MVIIEVVDLFYLPVDLFYQPVEVEVEEESLLLPQVDREDVIIIIIIIIKLPKLWEIMPRG